MAKPKVSDAAKMFIVQSLACFDSPSVVAAAVKTEFDVIISRQSIESYDPTKAAGAKMGPRWREIFDATRTAYLADIAKVGISHMAVRLRILQRMVDKVEVQGNSALVAQLLEQAAKEVGGSYTNRREITGKDGGSIKTETKTETRTWRQILRDEHEG
ncbi:DUF2280 domain-containing protein [Rhizobium leguminosarum]|uniref:DUF2280 domain-containing protein n=1 Tax=Rhizobium leguminosarum TaxID=384 RepID=UPI001031BF59|nr:DUF2280 domain-containing protein [Rhizobium leguminosarum]TBH09919.1 DUF2280 domain-containing protein [Rhizobium leguminosarum]